MHHVLAAIHNVKVDLRLLFLQQFGAFTGVGAIGFAVQLALVAALTGLARWPAPAATALGVSPATVGREWAVARMWLRRELEP